ncbi:MAG: FAD-dependent oxidoreductase [Acidobacteriota bacterium]
MSEQPALALSFKLTLEDLYSQPGLARLDTAFLAWLRAADGALADRLDAARANPEDMALKDRSRLILDLSPLFEDFLAELFGIHSELNSLRAEYNALAPLYAVKRKFVQRSKAVLAIKPEEAANIDIDAVESTLERLLGEPITELSYARAVDRWLGDEPAHSAELAAAAQYAAWSSLTGAGKHEHKQGVLFKKPEKIDPFHLVPIETLTMPAVAGKMDKIQLPEHEWRRREAFHLTDHGTSTTGALDEANYCIHCHNQAKDSCRTGLKEKTGEFKQSVFGVTLNGCPLDEKISEMHEAMIHGQPLGAAAIITIDNPLAAGTGHRICNDCMKACIFQKQEPVNIPQAETRTLKNVLELPWGFEIYSLLTRWNPLNFEHWMPAATSGYKVLIVGLGPAGYTLTHQLLQEGHTVAAVDGLKIEPLPAHISGVDSLGRRVPFEPIYSIDQLNEDLDDRVMAGFGGVAEYGITVRWDKNFLKIIRLLLERRAAFSMFGGVRFGGTLTAESAFELGFDHIALCAGAGRPTFIDMENGLARGVRQASDFLMALQLTGAAKTASITNLQMRMPVVVIGGGLTAIDTATESLAYYPRQVKKFATRYDVLVRERGEEEVRRYWNEEDREAADEFLKHAHLLHDEDTRARAEGREPNYLPLLHSWGGVTIAYRRRLIDSPSYTLNHEEVKLALEEGIWFSECLSPAGIGVDRFGHAASLTCEKQSWDDAAGKLRSTGEKVTLAARSILVAAGTQPNTVAQREDPNSFTLDGKYFQALDEDGTALKPEKNTKPSKPGVLTSVLPDGRAISFFGDLHPSFAGNVVKAMASAKAGAPIVDRRLRSRPPAGPAPAELLSQLNNDLRPRVKEVIRLTPNIIEVVVEAPIAARAFQPGQFYRLQNFETSAKQVDGTLLAMEGLALTGAQVDREKGLLSTIVLEMGGSSDLCAMLEPGEPVVLMGPTGTPTETPAGETVMLVGGGLGNAVLFSIGQTLRAHGSRVIYFAGYKKMIDRYKIDEIERAADCIVWCCDEAPGFDRSRPGDRGFVGNIVEAIKWYGNEVNAPIRLQEVQRLIAIGSDRMMAAVGQARHTVLKDLLPETHVAIASINSPMQCMMKEICAQCLQKHKDPITGKERVVFSCFNQDQPLDEVDFSCLNERLGQNGLQEKLTRQWIDRSLKQLGLREELVAR